MRHSNIFTFASAFLISIMAIFAMSCQELEAPVTPEEEEEQQPASGSVILSSTLEQPSDTKMRLSGDDTDGFDLVWGNDDSITVIAFDGSGTSENKKFTISSGGTTSSALFEGTLSSGFSPRYAVFPSGLSPRITANAMTANIAQKKSAMQGNISKGLNFCVSKIDQTSGNSGNGPDFLMKNVMGLLRITLTSDKEVRIKRMTLHDLGGNMLWGKCSLPIDQNGDIDYQHATFSGGDNTIYMEWNTPANINSSAKSFYLNIPVGALDRGFSIVLYEADSDGNLGRAYTFIQKTTDTVAAMRNVILALPSTKITEKSEPLDVAERGYYKSLFIDAGNSLNHYYSTSHIPAITELGLDNDYEYISTKTVYSLQEDIMVENDGTDNSKGLGYKDDNGVLLYPDGEPRFRAMFVNGGSSQSHGEQLGHKGCENIHKYYMNGGSFMGACAGAILASTKVDNVDHYSNPVDSLNWTFGIWPANVVHTGWPKNISTDPDNPIPLGDRPSVYTAQKVFTPLVDYSKGSLANNMIIEDVRHHGGIYISDLQLDNVGEAAERIADYYYSYPHERGIEIDDMLRFNPDNIGAGTYFGECDWWTQGNKCSTVGYKRDTLSGRAILCGSHFESAKSGAQLNFFTAEIKYALAGNGSPTVKAQLTPGQTYSVNKSTSDNDPAHTKIGDLQYHHFMFETTADTPEATITLDSAFGKSSGIDLYLGLRKGDFAWMSDADYVLTNKGGQKVLNIKNLPAGKWYVSVYCATAIESEPANYSATYYFKYSGHTELMEGAAYSLKVDLGNASSGN